MVGETRVIVIGSGPAGLAAAAATADAGFEPLIVAPAPTAPWPNRYGLYVDELDGLDLGAPFAATWPVAEFRLDGVTRQTFDRPYARVDPDALRATLLARAGGVAVLCDGRVAGTEAGPRGVTVTLDDGRRLTGALVIDASGARRVPHVGVQVAHGLELEVDAHPYALDRALLMDFDDAHLEPTTESQRVPSFLYALPRGPERVFVEETSLVGRPPVDEAILASRLERRLARAGVKIRRVLEVERCAIPMGAPIPEAMPGLVPFGAAASMVHPATGYLLALVLRSRPTLAAALREALPGDPREASAAVLARLWPTPRRRLWSLYRTGMEVLIGLDSAATRAFFRAFFAAPPAEIAGYLSATLSPGQTRRLMARTFAAAPMSLELAILGRALRTPLAALGLVG